MAYRKDIDGLRAVAVIPVILFHAGFQSFSGGFVGVDVFFVISGYLITTIILSDMEKGTFSLANFYERRVRRILPALFLVMFVCLIAAYFWLTPPAFQDFSQSLVAVSTFSANIKFMLETGYWDAASELKPLLHTWSLAVEEQYYVLFPIFLMVMWRFRRRWIVGSFLVVTVLSLGLAEWGVHRNPSATFFLLPTRAWELGIGAGIAFYFLFRKQAMRTLLSHQWVDELMSLVGLLMIGYAVFAFDETVPFPGLYALIPTLGTALIILFSSPQTLTGRLLGTNVLVGVGLISYSAYLWHFPLFAFARHRSFTEPGEALFLLLALISFPLAYLSWRYVEKPFRKKDLIGRKTIFTLAVVGSVFFFSIGLAGHLAKGWPGRLGEKVMGFMPEKREMCSAEEFQPGNICELAEGRNKLTFLIGDSHAGAIAHEMQKAFSGEGFGLLHVFKYRCPPVLDVYRADSDLPDMFCYEFNERLYRFIGENENIEYVVMLARWTLSMEGTRFDNQEGGVERSRIKPHLDLVVNGQPEYHESYQHRPGISARYSESIQTILNMGKKVILVYPVPEAGWDVPRYVLKHLMFKPEPAFNPSVGSTAYHVFKERNARTYEALDKAGTHPNLYRIYPEEFLCNKDVRDRCIVQKEGYSLYRDDDHLSDTGAKLIADQVIGHIRSLEGQARP